MTSHPNTDVEHLNRECGSAGRMGTAPPCAQKSSKEPMRSKHCLPCYSFQKSSSCYFFTYVGEQSSKGLRFPLEISSDSNTGREPHSQLLAALSSATLFQPGSLDLVNCEESKTACLFHPLGSQTYWTTSTNEKSRELLGWFRATVPQHTLEMQRSSILPYTS